LLTALSDVEIGGGQGFLRIADVDTVFLDALTLVVLVLVWRRRRLIDERWTLLLFGIVLSGITAVLLGYVVTNFGTLWRMRAVIALPIWMTVLTLTPRAQPARATVDQERSPAARPQ
jgi:hypothetical protein